jgi:hypothetical protein
MSKQTERIRTTISVDKEVHQIFVAMADAGGMSVSRCMGEWLADTAEGAQFVAKNEGSKGRTKDGYARVASCCHGYAWNGWRSSGRYEKRKTPPPDRAASRQAAAFSRSKAPSSNTGLNFQNSK